MKFVALLSGGKDSIFSIQKCCEEGHELICLANLCPPPPSSFPDSESHATSITPNPSHFSYFGFDEASPCESSSLASFPEEINSYMFQSAASSAIPQQAACLGVPLIRRVITGGARRKTLQYLPTEEDETEDLFDLLREVKERLPQVEAVCCGAIVSNYQRFRIESVCQRLNLTSLCYLWQRDRGELLQEMLSAGVVAVLVKTAGAGLEPERHLGKTLNELYPTLQRLHERFELDMCGEGGEYETLVLDSPMFSKELVLSETTIDYDEEDASVGNLRVVSCHTVSKQTGHLPLHRDVKVIAASNSKATGIDIAAPSENVSLVNYPSLFFQKDGLCQTGMLLSLAQSSPTKQLHDILNGLSKVLTDRGFCIRDAVFVHLYVSDMRFFSDVNREYSSWFGHNPPSRSCVQTKLGPGEHIAVDVLLQLGSHEPGFLGVKSINREVLVFNVAHMSVDVLEKVLHVRSISSWAPVCIGPYAQANVLHDHVVFVAGQIALEPSTMLMLRDDVEVVSWHKDFLAQFMRDESSDITCLLSREILHCLLRELFLSLHHTNSILSSIAHISPTKQLHPSKALSLLVFVDFYACMRKVNASEVPAEKSKLFNALKVATCCYINSFRNQGHTGEANCSDDSDGIDDEESEHGSTIVPVIVVEVEALPRNALVEVELVGTTKHIDTSSFQSTVQSSTIVRSTAVPSIVEKAIMECSMSKGACGGIISLISDNIFEQGECFFDLSHAVDLAVQCLKTAVSGSELSFSSLRVIKIFSPSYLHRCNCDISCSFVRALSPIGVSVNPIVMPVTALELNQIFSIQFLFLDLNSQSND